MGGLGVKVQHFPLTLLVVLTTLTLPCERDPSLSTATGPCQEEEDFCIGQLRRTVRVLFLFAALCTVKLTKHDNVVRAVGLLVH